jgi:hypothetical protein
VVVERTVREVEGLARPCLSASAPVPLDAPLAIAFPPARIGRTLGGHAGLAGPGKAAGPIRIAVLLEGEEVGSAELDGGGWAPFRIDTTRSAGQVRSVSLVLTSPAPLALCLEALVLP